jgi:hypothetical protein
MITVHKRQLALVDSQFISAPRHTEFLHAAFQHGDLCIWYRCDTAEDPWRYPVIISGTGHEAPSHSYQHVGTVLTNDHQLVWHVFVEGGRR